MEHAPSLPDAPGAHNPRPAEVASLRAVEGEWPAAVREGLEADVRRVADRLRTLSPAQLAAAVGAHPSRAAGGRAAAALLAVAAQGIEERASDVEPRWRPVPELSDFAVGDQIAVTGHDLVALLPNPSSSGDHAVMGILVGPEETVWTPGTRRTALDILTDAAAELAALRRLL